MGDLELHDADFADNFTASYGGGLITMARLDASGSSFTGNTAYRGGGLAVGFPLDDNNYLSPTYLDFYASLEGSQVSNNSATDAGGGIWSHHGGSLMIKKSTISGNEADAEGGGIYQKEGNLYIDNSTIAENTAFRGGGLYNHDGVSTDPILRLIHTTIAYNTATDTGSELRSSGGGLNINGIVFVEDVLVAHNTSNDCDLNQLLAGTYADDCGETYCLPIPSVDTDGSCRFYQRSNPQLGTFNGAYVPILAGSPLIDWSSCSLPDDQIGTARPQGAACEPGSIEYDANSPPPPPPPAPPDEASDCDPFAGMEVGVYSLSVNPETLVFPVYLRFGQDVPDANEDGIAPYFARLGNLESYRCDTQGFPDRLYCLFNLRPEMPGTLQTLDFFKIGCDTSAFSQPAFSIPEINEPEQPQTTCSKDLGEEACKAAGGFWLGGKLDDPYCLCP
jgi:hypothetical protein